MNERIKGLKEQALIWAIETLDPDALNDNEWAVAIDEKFAELIVKECCELTLDYKGDDYYNGWLDYRDEIKRHFGVEE
jgi:hypothetical protein